MSKLNGENRQGTLAIVLGIATISFLVGIFVVVIYLELTQGEPISGSNVFEFINSIATILLVLVTSIYVFFTYWLVRESRHARQQDIQPILDLSLEPYSLTSMGPKLENIGNGPAKGVRATVRLEPDDEKSEINAKNIRPGDFAGSLEPTIPIGAEEDHKKLHVEGRFEDVLGHEHKFEDEFDLEILSEEDGADTLMDHDSSKTRMWKIEQNLKDISDSIELDQVNHLSKIKIRKIILDEFEKEGNLTSVELAQRIGVHPMELQPPLSDLVRLGVVESRDEKSAEEILKDRELNTKLWYVEKASDED